MSQRLRILTYGQYESCNNQTTDALDAYQRAADLDPGNIHIKARLQLLRENRANGVASQPAPPPQDVHPQHYQNASVAGPPGPQWGLQAPHGPPTQAPPPAGAEWTNHLNAIEHQPRSLYDQREPLRGPPPPPPARQPSPRVEQLRHYDQVRGPPARRPSPPPLPGRSAANPYAGPPALQPPQAPPTRISNPNYGAAPPPGMGTPPAGHHVPMPPPGRGHSPPLDIKPIADDRVGSPAGGGLPHMQTRGHLSYQPSPMTSAGPPPSSYPAPELMAGRERDDRPPTGFKQEACQWR